LGTPIDQWKETPKWLLNMTLRDTRGLQLWCFGVAFLLQDHRQTTLAPRGVERTHAAYIHLNV